MAKLYNFPRRDAWSKTEKLIAKKMKQEGFDDDTIKTVNERVRTYREKYVETSFDVDFVISDLDLDEQVVEEIRKRFTACVAKIQIQIHQLTNNILEERISVEIALLD